MDYFIPFDKDLQKSELPAFFTNPFNYTPHILCINASEWLQEHLKTQHHTKGKMYGVLVVKNIKSELGFIVSYSGNEANRIDGVSFVPQVFDLTDPKGFFRKGEAKLNELNTKIKELENADERLALIKQLRDTEADNKKQLQLAKENIKEAKSARAKQRQALPENPENKALLSDLIKESQREKSLFNQLKKELKDKLSLIQYKLQILNAEIAQLKTKRKNNSAQLQERLFDNYIFINANGDKQSASTIFKETAQKTPPAGTGDCAAPKLLQFAFLNKLEPIAMAEFWWGESPKKEIRKHTFFYPACKSKCEPILGFMLQGLKLESIKTSETQNIEIIYDDDHISIINKPEGLLSVPGKECSESVYTQYKRQFLNSDGPLIVHRLDMATSGIMIIAKTKSAHEHLQKQFLAKTIRKRYVAILNGTIKKKEGYIDLPLRVDLDDRPRQLVCDEHGKPALTKWKVIDNQGTLTRVSFWPISGRTHQLRVHAAHQLGLNTPIVGDELYGVKSERLMLHAEEIEFIHPHSQQKMQFECSADF